ncbi:MAG TPA: hypothetical protein VGX50_07265 [Longimicrobium sp.]|jgi:hypothetical protein|nr:hypothetical protein [Longimicrobium sp.]
MAVRRWALPILLLTLASGCAGGRSKPSLGKEPPRATVHVANNNFADITVYVVQSGMRWRLGTVSGLSRQQFRMPRLSYDAGDLHLLADPVGGARSYLSPPVRVHAGEAVDLRLHATLSMSSVSVFSR